MKFCKDCKYGQSLWCNHPSNGVSPVTGQVRPQWAAIMRQYANRCDEEGLLWEPRWFVKPLPPPPPRSLKPENETTRPWWKFWSK